MRRYRYLLNMHRGGEAIIPSLYHVEKKLIATEEGMKGSLLNPIAHRGGNRGRSGLNDTSRN
jgi:hypothetical protein